MALFYLNRDIARRGSTGGVILGAALRHACVMKSALLGRTYDFSHLKSRLVHDEILFPECVPSWVVEKYGGSDVGACAELLWNDVERREFSHRRAAAAQLADRIIVALPRELSASEQVDLLRGWVREFLMKDGRLADIAVHDAGDGNPCGFILRPKRLLENEGFGCRVNDYMARHKSIIEMRHAWASAVNVSLERVGSTARVDHRRLDGRDVPFINIFTGLKAGDFRLGTLPHR